MQIKLSEPTCEDRLCQLVPPIPWSVSRLKLLLVRGLVTYLVRGTLGTFGASLVRLGFRTDSCLCFTSGLEASNLDEAPDG